MLATYSNTPLAPRSPDPKTILVVDDYIATRALHASMLQRLGYNVIQATNGFEACTVIAQRHVDGIVLDVNMPQMNGLEFLRTMRTSGNPHETPVVVVTSEERRGVLDELRSLGAQLLRKPSRAVQLKEALDALSPCRPTAVPINEARPS